MKGKELATTEITAAAPGGGALITPRGLMELAQGKAVINQLMSALMKGPSQRNPLGVHYGVIPGTPKPTLFKPGSELILSTFRIAVDVEVEDLGGEDLIRYRVKAIGRLPDGSIVGYGIGECSTDEEKYKWRKAANKKEFEATDPTRRRVKHGSGQNGDYETQQIRTNPADLANTVLKMAKKRAQIDLTLTATGASDVFDQDLEDLVDVIDITGYRKPQGGKPEVTEPAATGGGNQGGNQNSGGSSSGGNGGRATYDPAAKVKPGGAALVRNKLRDRDVPEAEFCLFMGIESVDDLLSGDMNRAIKAIENGEIPVGGA